MNDVLHANIFFFITAIAVVLFTLALLVALYYVIRILQDVRAIVAKVRKAGDELERDFEQLRDQMRAEGARVLGVFDLLLGFLTRWFTPSRRRKRAKEERHTDENAGL